MENEDLVFELKVALATSFTFYMKAHNFHINVVGMEFPYLHNFFKEIYEEVHDSVDVIAELIRAENSFSPFSYERFAELSNIGDTSEVPQTCTEMLQVLSSGNRMLLESLKRTRNQAETIGNFGVTNAIEDLITATQKRQWMLTATLAK